MPICPRCGKSLSSDQALTYHLNRKYKCGTWKCSKCYTPFDTKFALNIHETSCKSERNYILPSYDILCNIYTKSDFIFIEVDAHDIIHNISPNCQKYLGFSQQELIGKKDTAVIHDDYICRMSKQNSSFNFKRMNISDNLYVEYLVR